MRSVFLLCTDRLMVGLNYGVQQPVGLTKYSAEFFALYR